MAKVTVSLVDEQIRGAVAAALAGTRHETIVMEPLDPAGNMAALADAIMAEKAEVIIIDYWADDAASVKLMQAVTDTAWRPEFIFIEGAAEKAEREQVLMALNEGAHAFLPHSFNTSALISYVERSLSIMAIIYSLSVFG